MVQRLDLALARALLILIEIALKEENGSVADDLRSVLDKFQFSLLWESLDDSQYDSYVRCDENWLFSILRAVNDQIANSSGPLPLKQLALKVYLPLVCDRRKTGLRHFWKRTEEYSKFAKRVAELVAANTPKSMSLPAQTAAAGEVTRWFNNVVSLRVGDQIKQVGRMAAMRKLEDDLQLKLQDVGVKDIGLLIQLLRFEPYKSLSVWETKEGKLTTLDSISVIVRELNNMWAQERHFRPFWWNRVAVENSLYQFPEAAPVKPTSDDLAGALVKLLSDQ